VGWPAESAEGGVMGDIADDLISGRSCSWCGIIFEEEHGYPVVCLGCWQDAKPQDRLDVQKAIYSEMQ
jgi:hypothetical protein